MGYATSMVGKEYFLWVLVCGVPIALLTYKSYELYTRQAEAMLRSKEELAGLYLATVKSLALAIDAKDAYTHQHILRVQRYAVATAKELGLTGDALKGVDTSALLHDIGKLGVPEYILLKPGKLTDAEFDKIKEHPRIGADILADIPFPFEVLSGVKYHHEKWNGGGYPEGLKGEEIPLQARILAVADVYDAVTSNRAYRNAWTHERAVELVRKESGVHFDPVVAAAFLRVIDSVVEELAAQGEGPLVMSRESESAESNVQRAVRDIQRNSSEIWALYDVSQTLSANLGLDETLDILSKKLQDIIPSATCVFLLSDEAQQELVVRKAVGLNQEMLLQARAINPAGRSLQSLNDQKVYCGPYDYDDLTFPASSSIPWQELKSTLIVPLIYEGRKLGSVNFYHPEVDAFSEYDRQFLERIGERAALALYNGLLFERTQSDALTDTLTGLFNLRYVTREVEPRFRDTEQRPFTLFCLDLDSFKPINDLFGHQEGDRVLRDLSERLRLLVRSGDLIRSGDIVARYGGDEFLILLEGADRDAAQAFAQRIQEAIASYDTGLVHAKLGELRLGVSLGFACFPDDGKDLPSLLSLADQHMYQNKAEHKLERMTELGRSGRLSSKVDTVPYYL